MRHAALRFAAAAALLAPLAATALDAPHDVQGVPGSCMECHKLHNALGTSLTTLVNTNDQCLGCHVKVGNAFPWVSGDQATAGVSGMHHSWTASAAGSPTGATPPADSQMALRVYGGKLACVVCHDQHAANRGFAAPGTMRTSPAIGAAAKKVSGTSSATVTLVGATAAAVAKGYTVRVTGANLLAISHDNGLSWFRPSGGSWVADAATPVGGTYAANTDLALDDPAVTIRVAAGAVAGDTWYLYVGYPMMRANNSSGGLCLQCHQDRALTHTQIETGGDGVKKFSHPVGVTLNVNRQGYDRTTILDADGSPQGANTDGNVTNDLTLGADGSVSCITCHAAHGADSNSQTIDPR